MAGIRDHRAICATQLQDRTQNSLASRRVPPCFGSQFTVVNHFGVGFRNEGIATRAFNASRSGFMVFDDTVVHPPQCVQKHADARYGF